MPQWVWPRRSWLYKTAKCKRRADGGGPLVCPAKSTTAALALDGTPCRLQRARPHRQTPALPQRARLTATETLANFRGRITPVVVQSGPRPHRHPGQPSHGADTDHPAPAETVRPGPRRAGRGENPNPARTPHMRVQLKTHSTATVSSGCQRRPERIFTGSRSIMRIGRSLWPRHQRRWLTSCVRPLPGPKITAAAARYGPQLPGPVPG